MKQSKRKGETGKPVWLPMHVIVERLHRNFVRNNWFLHGDSMKERGDTLHTISLAVGAGPAY